MPSVCHAYKMFMCRYETTMSVCMPHELTDNNSMTRQTGIHKFDIIAICP